MAEPGTQSAPWAERMELLRDSSRERLLTAPMPAPAMEALVAEGKAVLMGSFQGSPVRYLEHWWRENDGGWEALHESATEKLDQHAERYQAALAASKGIGAGADDAKRSMPLPHLRHRTGEA